jgi:hypothetical protein
MTLAAEFSSHAYGVRFSRNHQPPVARYASLTACKPAARKGCEDISPGLSEAIPGGISPL